jgi:hypothetical protein
MEEKKGKVSDRRAHRTNVEERKRKVSDRRALSDEREGKEGESVR